MSAPDAETFDLLAPKQDAPPHRAPAMTRTGSETTGPALTGRVPDALPAWQALRGRSLESLIEAARGGDDEASRLLLKTFVLQHARGAIDPEILDYVAGCLETFTCQPRRAPDPDGMSLADVEECFSLHRPTPGEVWKALHLDRPRGRPEKAPFTRETSDVYLASCVATVRDSGATVEEAWETVRSERRTNLSRVKDAWRQFKHLYPPPTGE